MKVLEGQSIFDIAIQRCGSAEAAFDIALLNDLSITDDLTTGQELIVPYIANTSVADYYTRKHLLPATGVTVDLESTITIGGLGYMAIGIDFIVS
jgi:hypothetical protein